MAKKRKFNDCFGINYLTDLTLAERALLQTMATYAFSETGELYPSNDRLAYDCDMLPQAIRRLKKSLKDKNIIVDTGKTRNQVPVLKFNLDSEKFLIGTDKSPFKRITRGAHGVSQGEHVVSGGGAHGVSQGEHTVCPKHISEQVNEHISLTGEEKTPSLLEDKNMSKKNIRKTNKIKYLKDLDPNMDLREEKYQKPDRWNLTHLITLWDSTYVQTTGNRAVNHTPAHRANFRDKMDKSGTSMEEIAEAIEITVADWGGFYQYCNQRAVAYIPHEPDFRFFSRCMTQALDFAYESMKPVNDDDDCVIIYPT